MVKHHVLVVDDNPEIRGLILTTLGSTFFTLGEAANGTQALAYLAEHDLPNLIILDLAMPDISGLDVLEQVKSNPETAMIEVIVLSANANPKTEAAATHLGARAVLAKPFSPLQLLQTVEKVLG